MTREEAIQLGMQKYGYSREFCEKQLDKMHSEEVNRIFEKFKRSRLSQLRKDEGK